MRPTDLRNMQTIRNSFWNALPCANMALKLRWYFYLLMEKPLGRYLQVLSPYYQVTKFNQKTPIPVSSRWLVKSDKAKKMTNINTNYIYHQPSFPWASLNWFNNKVRLSFNQPNRKRWSANLVDQVKNLPHKVFLSWRHY